MFSPAPSDTCTFRQRVPTRLAVLPSPQAHRANAPGIAERPGTRKNELGSLPVLDEHDEGGCGFPWPRETKLFTKTFTGRHGVLDLLQLFAQLSDRRQPHGFTPLVYIAFVFNWI